MKPTPLPGGSTEASQWPVLGQYWELQQFMGSSTRSTPQLHFLDPYWRQKKRPMGHIAHLSNLGQFRYISFPFAQSDPRGNYNQPDFVLCQNAFM
jgi:hypothetical protein